MKRFVNGHHIWFWINGGPTDKTNVLDLCNLHHHLVHEGGWKVSGNPENDVSFISPEGRIITGRRPPLHEEIKERFFGSGCLPWSLAGDDPEDESDGDVTGGGDSPDGDGSDSDPGAGAEKRAGP